MTTAGVLSNIAWSLVMLLFGAGITALIGFGRQRRRASEASHAREELDKARAQLAAFFDHVPVFMSLHETSGRFVLGTRTVLDAYGATPEQLRAMTGPELARFWPDWERLTAATASVVSTGEPQHLTTAFKSAARSGERLFEVHMFPIRSAEGRIVQMGALGIDITEQRRREEDLIRSQAILKAFFEHMPAGLSIKDRDRNFTMVNGYSARRYYGKSPEELIGRNAADLRSDDHARRLHRMEQRVLDSGQVETEKVAHKTRGEERQLQLMFFPITGADGSITHIGSMTHDITEQIKAEAVLAEREAQLSSLFEHVPAYITVFDRDHRAVMANHRGTALRGRDDTDYLGSHPSEFRELWPEYARLMAAGTEVFHDGQSRQFATTFYPPGATIPMQIDGTFFPIRAASGEVEQVGLFFLDVTEQRQNQAALAEQQANLLAFFDYAPLQVYVTDLDHKIVMVNDWVHRETGADVFRPANVIGLSADQMVPSNWADMSHDNDATVVGKRDVTQMEVRGQFGGKERDIISIRFPIKNADGDVVRIGGFVVDVSKQKQAERALQEQLAQSHQSEKLAALGQLLAGVAHELNNPLTVVVGRSAILEEKLAGTPHAKAIASLREAADRCNRIVKTFLAMARQSAPRRGRVQPNDAIEAALDMTVYGIRSAGIELDCCLEPGLPEVEADEDQLVQVITNLLINAKHALDTYDGPRKIRIVTKPVDGRVAIAIADSGPGVPEELESRIFEPFFTTKEVGQGTGMGLAMSRGMIEEHGGTLSYSTAPGGGARFEVSLPIADGAEDEAEADAEAEAPGKSHGRVLIVDDEASIREMLGEILAGAGLDFVEAADGASALQCLAGGHFDLIFSDVRMPGMDGIALRRELAESRPELLERLIFMSGDVLQRDRARYAEIGDHLFVEKPFNPAEVRKIALGILGQPGDPR